MGSEVSAPATEGQQALSDEECGVGHIVAPIDIVSFNIVGQVAKDLRKLPALYSIPDFDGYWITRDARIYSTKLTGGRGGKPRHAWLTQRPHPRTGHLRVDMRDVNHKRRTIQVQCLVAWSFLGPQPEGTYVCHVDGKETNNDPKNLYYGTPWDNAQDREYHKLVQEEGLCMCDDRELEYVIDAEIGF